MKKPYIFVVVILFLFVFSVPAQAYNNDWTYKKPITINNSQNPNGLFEYQLLLNISYEIGMKIDFSDLRFSWLNASSNVEAPISYFIENYTANLFSDVWIKMPKISTSNYEAIYMYYGNPSAISESNPNATFDLYDDFEELDTNKWNVTGNVSMADGEVKLFDYTSWILSKSEFGEQVIKEARSRSGGGIGFYLSVRNDDSTKYISIRGSNGADPFWFDTYNGLTWHGGDIAPIDNIYHIWKLERNGTSFAKIYQDGKLLNTLTEDLPSGSLKVYFRGGEYSGTGYYTYIDWVRVRKYADPEPTYIIEKESNNSILKIGINTPKHVQAEKIFLININVTDISNNPITNLTASDFKIFRDNEQTNFTDFHNYNNSTYSMNISSGNTIGNISLKAEVGSDSDENFFLATIKPKTNIVFVTNGWENIFLSGLTGKPVFTNYSETEKYYFSKIRPEQVFVFDNTTADYPTYRFKDRQAFLETFYSNQTAITVSSREQALAAAAYAKIKNYPILFNPDESIAKQFDIIANLSGKTTDEITGMAIKETAKARKNINTIIITNHYSETSALAGALAAKHGSIIVPINFSTISYPETVSDFYSLNSANGVLQIKQKINETIKKLSDSFLFSNSLDYKLGRIRLNLILLGNASEVPQPVVFDSGKEIIFDYDSNYLPTDFPYSDANNDGKADLIGGRIVSPYQLIELPKSNKIVTAAIYRNLEIIFSSNGLIESQAADTFFRTAAFEAVRLVENRTSLSYYELTFGFSNITDFLKKLFEEQSITESLKLTATIYNAYSEFLEHNYYKMMNSMSLGFEGITIKMIPDERLTKESLLEEMQNTDGIFYYGKGDANSWMLESFRDSRIYFNEFPETSSMIYDEHTNSARMPEKIIFEKGISALVGSSGIIYDVYSFTPNAIFVQNIAKNKSIALSLENSKYPLLPNQIKNLTAVIQFTYQPELDLSLKRFLEMVCYCDPEKKIDPAEEKGNNPIINYSTTFKSRVRIPINYIVAGDRIFFDAKQYLQEMGRPVIPLYTADIVLPNSSKIVGISFNYNFSRHENISADFIHIEHFNETEEAIHGFYPSQLFYNETFELLDGRKEVKLIAAGMQYNNDTKEALVFSGIEAVIEYSAPFEFIEFSAENITIGSNQTFRIKAVGDNLSVVIDIKNRNFSETVESNIPSGYAEISWKPPFIGNFSAIAHVLMGNNSAGPRYAYFSVTQPKQNFFMIFDSFGIDGYEKVMKSFTEKIQFAFNGASVFFEYLNPSKKFSLTANSSRIEKAISNPHYSFKVLQDSGKMVYSIKNSKGELVLEKNTGTTKEICRGDCSELYEKIDSESKEMQELSDYVIGNIVK